MVISYSTISFGVVLSDKIYLLKVVTGTKFFGGTDQQVFLTIHGVKGITKEIHLTRRDPAKAKALFERGR
jgi:peroxiredoxin family protein